MNNREAKCDWVVPYVAGITDAHFNFVSKISKDSTRKVGYKIQFELKYNTEIEQVLELLEEFLSSIEIEPRVRYRDEKTYDRFQIILGRMKDISIYLSKLMPYLTARRDAADILANSIIPKLNNGEHSSRKGFIEIVDLVEQLRKKAGRDNRSKYDKEYFIEEWNI